MITCYLGLGSNLGDRRGYILAAIEKIKQLKDTQVTKISSIIESAAVGGPEQGDFLNAVIEARTALSCRQLLNSLQEIELQLGRVRGIRNAPRIIDLDILLFGDLKISEADLVVPHPLMKERDFVLTPLKQIAPEIVTRLLDEDLKKN